MFKLVILTEEGVTKRALKNSSAMLPNTSLTLDTNSIDKRTGTGMSLQAFPSVTYPCFAKVADGSLIKIRCYLRVSEGD